MQSLSYRKIAVLAIIGGSFVSLSGGVSAQTVLRGDLNGDAKLGVADAVLGLQLSVGNGVPTAAQLLVGDINSDGKINIQDVIRILRASVGLEPLPPLVEPPGPGTEDGTDILYNQKYEGGTRLRQQQVGVSWVMPKDWVGTVGPKDLTFGMASPSHSNDVGFVIALATAPNPPTVQVISQIMAQPMDVGGGIVFQADSAPQIAGNRISATYSTLTTLGKVVGLSVGELSPNGNALGFFVAGVEAERNYLKGVLDELIGSARYSSPKTDPWIQLLAGSKFRLDGGTFTMHPDGTSTSTDNNTFLDFCANMVFAYHFIGFISASGDIIESHEDRRGQWGIAMDLVSTAAVLIPDDGKGNLSYKLYVDSQRQVAFNDIAATRFNSDNCH